MARKIRDSSAAGNFISEWFGHRVYPGVAEAASSLDDQRTGRCPFLSSSIGKSSDCIKPQASSGVCTISSSSNGPRQDWLVCPYRALDAGLMEDAASRLFGESSLSILPAPALDEPRKRRRFESHVTSGGTGIVFFQDKLGGEISLSKTDRSPEVAFDITMVEIGRGPSGFSLGRYGILEVQTMDFHGSYRAAVANLRDALRLHGRSFPRALREHQQWLSEKIEGPNISNVFKRTFYQMMLKFQIATHESCAGCVLAIPLSVWDSWQRHLGRPELLPRGNRTSLLARPGRAGEPPRARAWIDVFDMEPSVRVSPNPIRLVHRIATDAESVAHFALKVAPEAALHSGGVADLVLATIRRRLATWWPKLEPR